MISCDSEGPETVINVESDAPQAELTRFATRLSRATGLPTGNMILRGQLSDPRVLDPEVAPPYAWQVQVTPGDSNAFELDLTGTLEAAAVPGAVGIVAMDGWPFVTVESLDQFEQVFTSVSATPLFANGGTYSLQSLNEQLRIVHVPSRTTDEAILEIIDIARDYPNAEVLLEAPTAGPQFPTFYVSRLSLEQREELDTRLKDGRLATADVDGYPLGYVLGSIGEDGTTYVSGTFGDVPGS